MTGTFIDTIIVCTMTGLSIVMMGTWADSSLEGVQVTTAAFQQGLYFLPSKHIGSDIDDLPGIFLPLQQFSDGIITERDVWNTCLMAV